MIEHIEINNFRSILEAKTSLTPLTTIVGANATGKSNLIKALEFISDLSRIGLTETLYKNGGYDEVIPKQITRRKDIESSFKLSISLTPPMNWELFDFPKLIAEYEIGISKKKGKIKITKEKLVIKHALLNSYYLVNKGEEEENIEKFKTLNLTHLYNTDITLERVRNKLKLKTDFQLNKDNRKLISYWLGLDDFLKIDIKEATALDTSRIKKIADILLNNIGSSNISDDETLILSRRRILSMFSLHFRKIRSEFLNIGKYDLLINELRHEQDISRSSYVNASGNNVASVTKRLSKITDSNQWERIITTMSNISPYFENVESKSLRAGKEYLEFKEIFGGKNIESWESSDGTLRAYAILLAIETHPNNSTLLIEEPEHGLHPWAIKDLLEHMRDSIESNSIQIILTTHSQQVLENIEPEELLISERTHDGTKFFKIKDVIDEPDISMGEVGELWVRGLLKGVPVNL